MVFQIQEIRIDDVLTACALSHSLIHAYSYVVELEALILAWTSSCIILCVQAVNALRRLYICSLLCLRLHYFLNRNHISSNILTLCMLYNFSCLCCHRQTFFKRNLSGTLSESQTVCIQIRTNVLSILIRVQRLSEDDKVTASRKNSFKSYSGNPLSIIFYQLIIALIIIQETWCYQCMLHWWEDGRVGTILPTP